ncbi:MAG: hypothetical protein ACI4C4_09955 [Lachnospiraceae bacterium]
MNRLRKGITKLHKFCKKKRDNRGSSIVIVIIAMAMIGILATTLLWMSYMNYMIKISDMRNKESFYSAEEVVEQIMAGLQNTSSTAVGTAYKEVIANWDGLETEENRFSTFATVYLDTVVEQLKDPSRGTGYYDRDKLKEFVDADIFNGATATSGVDNDAWEHGNELSDPEGEPKMEKVNDNSIILHNIYVSYTADDGRVSVVQTDICLDVPKLIFTQAGSIDNLYNYVMIGNQGIEADSGSGTIQMEGSIYAGTDEHGKGGITVNAATTLTVDQAVNVISKGDIKVEGPQAGFVVRDVLNENNSIYARNLKLNSGAMSLDGSTYVANDLSLNGSGSKVTLSQAYYGYGTSTYNGLTGEPDIDSANSSAIIINGSSSTVDMTGIKKLLIAGRAYIGNSATQAEAELKQEQIEAGNPNTSKPVMMGESIAVKGNQIAYLVPAECIGTLEGQTVVGQNPLSGDKEADMATYKTENGDKFKEVDFSKPVYKLGNKSLSDFGVSDDQHIRKVYAPYNGGTLVYYYLVMDKTNAEKYFVQYYDFNSNRAAIDRYFNKYASGGILLGDYNVTSDNQYTILGNSLVSSAISDSGVALLTGLDQSTLFPDSGEEGEGEGTSEGGEDTGEAGTTPEDVYRETGENADEITNFRDEADVLAFSANIADKYKALTTNLTDDASTIAVDQNVFNSIIKEDELTTYLDNNHVNTVTYTTDAGLKAVVTREADISLSGISDSSKVCLIISMGNVVIDRNFSGLVIAKGKIILANGAASVKWNKMELYKVLSGTSSISGDTVTPIDIFVAGHGSMINGAEEAKVDEEGNLDIDYGEIVRYMNWIKK